MLFITNLLIQLSYSTVIGIDLGGDSIKVAIGSRERGVHRVRNYYLNDVTPNLFAYIDENKWSFGEGAIAQCRYYPETCLQNQKLPLNNKYYFHKSIKGYQITALALQQVIKNAAGKLSIDPKELSIVVAIPPSMTNREKSFLYSSMQLTKYNAIRFVPTTYAPIETYLNEDKSPVSNSTVFIDIGHDGVRVSGFEFNRRKITQKVGLFRDQAGGRKIDENLMKLVIERYSIVLTNPSYSNERDYNYNRELIKNRVLLLAKIRRAREDLSNQTVVTFEFKNIKITLDRKDIDSCSQEVQSALTDMLTTLKNEHQYLLRSGDIHIIGGCSRIPCLQNHIRNLLPNIRIVQQMKKILSICKGACYIIDTEVKSNIKEHNSLITFNVSLKTPNKEYTLFSPQNYENFGPVVQLTEVEESNQFHILDKSDSNQEFCRFSIDLPIVNYKQSIDLPFSLNYFLMPVPEEPNLKGQSNGPLSINYIEVGWEISPHELASSQKVVDLMGQHLNQKFSVDFNCSEIDRYRDFVQEKLKQYFKASWRRVSFPAIVAAMNLK